MMMKIFEEGGSSCSCKIVIKLRNNHKIELKSQIPNTNTTMGATKQFGIVLDSAQNFHNLEHDQRSSTILR